jgi:hypothetical protein
MVEVIVAVVPGQWHAGSSRNCVTATLRHKRHGRRNPGWAGLCTGGRYQEADVVAAPCAPVWRWPSPVLDEL